MDRYVTPSWRGIQVAITCFFYVTTASGIQSLISIFVYDGYRSTVFIAFRYFAMGITR